MKYGIKIFTFKGTPVYIKYWFFLLFLLIKPEIVIAIFLSVLLHELAHTYSAYICKYETKKVSIDLLFGSAEIDINNDNQQNRILIYLAGPASNILLGILLSSIFLLNINLYHPISQFIIEFMKVNFILGIFNLIPVKPLDGCMILQSSLRLLFGRKNKSLAIGISNFISILVSLLMVIFSIYAESAILIIFFILTSMLSLYSLYKEK